MMRAGDVDECFNEIGAVRAGADCHFSSALSGRPAEYSACFSGVKDCFPQFTRDAGWAPLVRRVRTTFSFLPGRFYFVPGVSGFTGTNAGPASFAFIPAGTTGHGC